MNAKELRSKSPADLNNELVSLYREQFNLRMQKGTGQLAKPSRIKAVRRAIARIKTIMTETSKAGGGK